MAFRIFSLLSFLLINLLSAAQAPGTDTEDHAVLGLELAWNQAEIHRDVRAVDSLLGPDFLRVDHCGRLMNKTSYLAEVAVTGLQPSHIVNEDMQIRRYGDTAVIVSTYHEKGTDKGKLTSVRGRFTDVWVRRAGKWMCISSQETLIR